MGQITFPWEIDREATKEAVEQRLESARIYKQLGFIRREMKNTTSSEPRYHGATNEVGKPLEDVAVWNVDMEAKMKNDYDQIMKVVERLNPIENQIIVKRYLESDEVFDYNIYNELHLSERKYYRIKSNAIYKLAFALRLEKYVS